MSVRTFEAESMSQALARVKRELGPEAIILRTRTLRRGGVLGVGARPVIEVTAQRGERGVDTSRDRRGAEVSKSGSFESAPLQSRFMADDPAPLGDEVRQIRQMVHRMMRLQVTRPRPDLSDALFNQYLALLEQEVAEELADDIIQAARGNLAATAQDDPQAVRLEVADQLSRLIPVAPPPVTVQAVTGRPATIGLIGPTGVGKTTTIAKLAAHHKLRLGQRVALVTMDTYRIAAVEQLRTYAEILNVPLHIVADPQQMARALDACMGCDVVLVDTAGRSPRDADRLDDLRCMLRAARPDEVHLVLASNVSQGAMMQAVERFSVVGFDRVIFTKLDEAVHFGVLLNVTRKVHARLSYLTTGQEVPHRIEPGEPTRLASLILGEKL